LYSCNIVSLNTQGLVVFNSTFVYKLLRKLFLCGPKVLNVLDLHLAFPEKMYNLFFVSTLLSGMLEIGLSTRNSHNADSFVYCV